MIQSCYMALGERFRYSSGEPKNGFFICKELTTAELDICLELVTVGPLGMGVEDIKNIGIDTLSVEELVADGVVRRMTLLELAKDIVGNEVRAKQMLTWRVEGGLSSLDRYGDKNRFKAFEQAQTIIEQWKNSENLETRYQVIPDLYDYIDLIFDDR